MKNPSTILITGASSGLGRALAEHYAAPHVCLFLTGRHEARLDEIRQICSAKGAVVETAQIDVTDRVALGQWVAACDQKSPLDLVVANAGVSYEFDAATDDLGAHFEKTFSVNVYGVFNTVEQALPLMRPRGRGQIAIVSSLAGFRGLPSAPAYSTSKVTVKAYAEALRGVYAAEGIEINAVCPGFVVTPMTARNNFPMPFIMSGDKAAGIIARGLVRNKGRIAFPWPMVSLIWAGFNLLPNGIVEKLLQLSPRK